MTRTLLLALALLALPGCVTPLAAWERSTLQSRVMASGDPMEQQFDAHVQAVREAVEGATEVGGSSCGCN